MSGATAFVGRAEELAFVDERIDAVLSTQPCVVLCEGEAGMGKTRLAQEAAKRACERGLTTAWGVAEQMSGAPPFWPWIRVLRSLARRFDVVDIAARQGTSSDLARLAPEIFGAATAPVQP
ncbi:MAG: ATP-binding protein [Candidatus Dormibacteraeota bacterium]|nr:ATP-binding protein [Candidatus Dormibacteraeota bacterium]